MLFCSAGKGGIQLWQFLNYLLNNPEKKHRDVIEWTTNKGDKEFRMLEPETIAIWWGHHKNKPDMTYDKFSRSLRYYYDKGILKKIPGERFVYRFLIDPEVMYEHIGSSDCRPKIKPMPKAAKAAMTKFHKSHSLELKAQDVPRITLKAETLEESSEAMIHTSIQDTVPTSTIETSTEGSNSLQVTSSHLHSVSMVNLGDTAPTSDKLTTSRPIRRSKSLETPKTKKHLNHQNDFPFGLPSATNDLVSQSRAVSELDNLFFPSCWI